MDTINFTEQDLNKFISETINYLSENEIDIDCIIGITRGGLIPATYLSYQLEKPLKTLHCSFRDFNDIESYKKDITHIARSTYKSLLIVDDVIETGKTIKQVQQDLLNINKKIITCSMCLYTNKNVNELVNFYFKPVDRWVNFYWDKQKER